LFSDFFARVGIFAPGLLVSGKHGRSGITNRFNFDFDDIKMALIDEVYLTM
jgi:hypothetical protein